VKNSTPPVDAAAVIETGVSVMLPPPMIMISTGSDSSRRSDQKKTTTAKSGGVRNTTCYDETERIAVPRNGATMGVKRKIVKISDMVRAILSPTRRSRTPAMVIMKSAEAPTPATNRAASIQPRPGANAAAMLPPMYRGNPTRKIARRP
jgi:hypothetical protein